MDAAFPPTRFIFLFAPAKLEEEVERLGALAEEREKYCRYTAKALELLPSEGQGVEGQGV